MESIIVLGGLGAAMALSIFGLVLVIRDIWRM